MNADIGRLAKEAGLTDPDLGPWMTDYGNAESAIRKFAALVAEACASLYDDGRDHELATYYGAGRKAMAAEIRAKFALSDLKDEAK